MKKIVWKNKSNGQLCVTIPKSSNVREGDSVEIQKATIKKITYSGVVADLFHYGHLHSILFAKSISDYNIVGVITDEAVEEYRAKPIANIQERKAVIENLNCVDRVMVQKSRDHTENLKRIQEEFPEAKIVLVHGDDLKDIPGAEYIKKIGGKVVKHPYYSRLSTFKIINKIIENKDKLKDIKKFSTYIKDGGNTNFESDRKNKIIISSKADTLQALKPLLTKSKIEDLYSFTISDWKNKKPEIIKKIQENFSPFKIIVRSSAVREDTLESSMAGYFDSVLNVNSEDQTKIETAIETVLHSYKNKDAESSFNQVLVQKQTENIAMSGVIFTRTLEKNAPYYVINYDDSTGSTDSVTAGRENKTLMISHFATKFPEKMIKLLEAVKEIEEKIPGIPLDIEFAENKEKQIIIFQVRPLAVNIHKEVKDKEVKEKLEEIKEKFIKLTSRESHLAGETTFFADMPDWNPAEIIGDKPNHLDYSLYDYLITNSAWYEARTSQGYYNVNPAKLVESLGNKPYINVRNSFNSFVPAGISPNLREKLVHFYLEKLRKDPALQDKVEFEILYTCYSLGFDEQAQELVEADFNKEEIEELKKNLLDITNNLISGSAKNIEEDLKAVFNMEELRTFLKKKIQSEYHSPKELIDYTKLLLDECRKKGTVQFSRLARLGFIGKIILKSLLQKKIINNDFYEELYNSISTIATKISDDFKKLTTGKISKEEFLKEYYHLRPGTYDITSLRYDANPNLLKTVKLELVEKEKTTFSMDGETAEKINEEFLRQGLQFDSQEFIKFLIAATEARELAKFEFTKNLSNALELIAKAGEEMGFTRKELALMDINDLFKINPAHDIHGITKVWKELIKTKENEREIQDLIVLPSVIFSGEDFEVVEHYLAKPNYITQKTVESKVINIDKIGENEIPNLEGNIVVLENGDPGYDWIFTRNPAGLITKYGGVASHMSIRCAEFSIPAAIGCGEIIFNQVKNAKSAILDCKAQKVTPIRE